MLIHSMTVLSLMGGVDGAQAGAAGRLSAVWGGRVPDYKI